MQLASSDIPESEPQVPYPRRFWWLKRLGLSVLLLIAALLLARAIAVHRAQAAYDAEIASLRARGEPLTLEDLRQPPIPDEQNAAIYLQRAAQAVRLSEEQQSAIRVQGGTPKNQQIADDWVRENSEALALIRKARNLPAASWSALFPDPWKTAGGNAMKQRTLERLLFRAADRCAHDRDVIGFTEFCRDELAIERVLQLAPLSQYDALFASRFALVAIDRDHDLLTPGTSRESREPLHALALKLLDETPVTQCVERLLSELHASSIYANQEIDADPQMLFGVPRHKWMKALDRTALWTFKACVVKSDLARLHGLDDAEKMMTAPSFDATHRALKPGPPYVTRITVIDLRTYDYVEPLLTVRMYYRDLASRRKAALSLAIQLYKADGDGAMPKSLDELVPKYLPRVPADPFDPAGGPLRLKATNGKAGASFEDLFIDREST
jgi:hypothetical protein